MELSSRSTLMKLESKIIGPLTAVCGLLVFMSKLWQVDADLWQPAAVFALLSLLSQLIPTRLPQGVDFSVAFVLDLILIALYGTPIAVVTRFAVTFSAGMFSKILGRRDTFNKITKTTGQAVLIVTLTGLVYQQISHRVLAFITAVLVYFLVNTFFIALEGLATTRECFAAGWLSVMETLYINFFILSSLAYLLSYIIRSASSEWQLFSVLLFFVPVMLVNHAFRLAMHIKQSYAKTVKTIAAAIEAKDPYMKGHSERVAELTVAVAREFRIPDRELRKLEYVALLHDTGKVGISEEILNKPGNLSADEYDEVKKHSALGAEIIRKIKFLSSKSDIVLYHHERYDGSGYPAGLTGNNIPLESRILAVADAYDAMITDRPFRPAMTPGQAVEEMVRLSGTQFDSTAVEKLKTVLKKQGEL